MKSTQKPKKPPTEKELDKMKKEMLKLIKVYVELSYGHRCEDHEASCYVCKTWALYDYLGKIL